MKGYVLVLCLIAIATVVVVATACSTAGIERAEAQKWDAKARADAAPYVGQATLLEAESSASLEMQRLLAQLSKEERLFDAQLARNEFATLVLEFQALNLAIREETEAAQRATAELMKVAEQADGVGHNALAAARNTFLAAWVLAALGVLVVGYGAALVVITLRFEKRFSELQGAVSDRSQ